MGQGLAIGMKYKVNINYDIDLTKDEVDIFLNTLSFFHEELYDIVYDEENKNVSLKLKPTIFNNQLSPFLNHFCNDYFRSNISEVSEDLISIADFFNEKNRSFDEFIKIEESLKQEGFFYRESDYDDYRIRTKKGIIRFKISSNLFTLKAYYKVYMEDGQELLNFLVQNVIKNYINEFPIAKTLAVYIEG